MNKRTEDQSSQFKAQLMQLRKERLKKFRLAKIGTLTFEMYLLYMTAE